MRTFLLLLLGGCGSDPAPSTGPAPVAPPTPPPAAAVGPDGPADLAIPDVTVSTDPAVVARGEAVFGAKGCGGCHKFGEKLVGPDLNGVGERRSPTWIGRMIRHPGDMVRRDPVAKRLLGETMTEMPNQGVADDELSPLVSFLASHTGK